MRSWITCRKLWTRPSTGRRRSVTEPADGMAADLGGDFQQEIDVIARCHRPLARRSSDAPHPARAFAAGRALAAALMHVEIGEPRRQRGSTSVDLSMHDDGARAEGRTLARLQRSRNPSGRRRRRSSAIIGTRRAARNDRQEIIPAAAHAAGMTSRSARAAERPSLLRHCRALFTWPEMQKILVPVLFGTADRRRTIPPRAA